MTTRRPFSEPVQREIRERATRNSTIYCEGCGMDLTGKKTEIDHIIAEALVPDWKKDNALTAKDGQLLGECCHRGRDGKTNKDVKAAAKAKRQNKKHSGTIRPKGKIANRGFEPSGKTPKINKAALPELPRKRIYG